MIHGQNKGPSLRTSFDFKESIPLKVPDCLANNNSADSKNLCKLVFIRHPLPRLVPTSEDGFLELITH